MSEESRPKKWYTKNGIPKMVYQTQKMVYQIWYTKFGIPFQKMVYQVWYTIF